MTDDPSLDDFRSVIRDAHVQRLNHWLNDCVLCREPMADERSASVIQPLHRVCALRSAIGGIGHLIAHDYWCLQRHDPDAGLTYRQSALLVDEYVTIVGVEAATVPSDR